MEINILSSKINILISCYVYVLYTSKVSLKTLIITVGIHPGPAQEMKSN